MCCGVVVLLWLGGHVSKKGIYDDYKPLLMSSETAPATFELRGQGRTELWELRSVFDTDSLTQLL